MKLQVFSLLFKHDKKYSLMKFTLFYQWYDQLLLPISELSMTAHLFGKMNQKHYLIDLSL